MKRCILLLALIFGFQLTMTAQKSKPNTTSSPKEDIHVNKEFDSNGNLIKFDSVYSYTWSGDTTLLDSIHPKFSPEHLGGLFNFSPGSSFFDNSFFGDFDQLFFDPFSKKQDSIMNHLGMKQQFRNFQFRNDTTVSNLMDMDDFLRQFNEHSNDSIFFKSPGHIPFQSQPKSMDEMMKMLQQKMKEMEEQQHQLFEKSPKL
jgi:hypothetical protein